MLDNTYNPQSGSETENIKSNQLEKIKDILIDESDHYSSVTTTQDDHNDSSSIERNLSSNEPLLSDLFQDKIDSLLTTVNLKTREQFTLVALQEWEGYVTKVDEENNFFTASLIDMTASDEIAKEEADFSIDDLSSTDINMLNIGSVFRWTIGYQRSPSGTKRKVSQINFRKFPKWTKRALKKAEDKAKHISKSIKWT